MNRLAECMRCHGEIRMAYPGDDPENGPAGLLCYSGCWEQDADEQLAADLQIGVPTPGMAAFDAAFFHHVGQVARNKLRSGERGGDAARIRRSNDWQQYRRGGR